MGEKSDELCFNLWLDNSGLELPKNKQSLQSAMDLILVKPLLNREMTYEKLVETNDWAKKWVATGYSKLKVYKVYKVHKDGVDYLMSLLNLISFWGQYIYMKPKMRGEVVSLRQAFFHPVV